jgi:hypothetical protein
MKEKTLFDPIFGAGHFPILSPPQEKKTKYGDLEARELHQETLAFAHRSSNN